MPIPELKKTCNFNDLENRSKSRGFCYVLS